MHKKNYFYIVFALILELILAGPFFGWPSLAKMLKDQGVANSSDTILNWIFTTAMVGRLFAVPIQGLINDRYGPAILMYSSLVLAFIGCCLVAWANTQLGLWISGYLLYGIASNGIHVSIISSAKHLLKEHATIFVSLCNGFFDLGTLVFTGVRLLNMKPQYFFEFWCVGTAIVFLLVIWWPQEEKPYIAASKYLLQLKEPLTSPLYLLFIINHVIIFYWISAYLGTVQSRSNSDITSIFSIIMAFIGFGLSFVVGPTIRKFGYLKSWILIYTLLWIWTIMLIIPGGIITTILSFVFYSIARPFYYSVSANYIADKFGYTLFGRLLCLSYLASGPFTFTQTPLLSLALYLDTFWVSDSLQIATLLLATGFIFIVKKHEQPL